MDGDISGFWVLKNEAPEISIDQENNKKQIPLKSQWLN